MFYPITKSAPGLAAFQKIQNILETQRKSVLHRDGELSISSPFEVCKASGSDPNEACFER